MMNKTVVIDIVGLSTAVIGEHTPFLKAYIARKNLNIIEPLLPAVTTAVQSAYLTGKYPVENGIVGNGWYDRIDSEVKFWKQSNKLVNGDKIWDKAKKADASFTSSMMFWWYNMYSTADYSVTPRPNYLADGRKMPDCYSHPAALRDELQEKLGQFPLFQFWGPGANIKSSKWIADASMYTDDLHNPTLTLIYLPHLDYCLQKFGPYESKIAKELGEIDALLEELVTFYEKKEARIILLSEYGIAPVSNPIHLNRLFREHNLLQIRVERGLELLDPGASKAFVVADHQIAHVYINDPSVTEQVKALLKTVPGIELVLDREGQSAHHINHERAGELVLVAAENSWFTYYFWLDDAKAPDYARVVDIHKKPGYDPVEMFMTSKARAGYKLLRKKAGLRYVMDVIPLDATLIKGSHGRINVPEKYKPVLITNDKVLQDHIAPVDIFDIIWQHLTKA
ncbi:alkaline phosphatase family protein [Mucilaginibacter pocheonensis]|uniref:AlkP superfamily pyrophosphatase or phosphodiesterase n=1 Tax=Mucilaginibacter pocheonensis TaxID=398050 RepID=A0ABU1TIQ4_9SPHI|nr:alkaline phosphatase family protein [Mucilaginibacter pocheonensis]MDR6944715.1 putative AlkP superfamily pyrophosphatase or phosphodiesterase [Mucilaginibacter pocheonensis]